MSEELELPDGEAVEIEFIREDKPAQRGILPQPLDSGLPGFELIEVRVPTNLGFRDAFRVDRQRKWINLSTVAEIRYLDPSALHGEVDRLRQLHGQVQSRMENLREGRIEGRREES